MTKDMFVQHIIDIAKEIETEDPIDWGMLAIDEDHAYRLLAYSMVEQLGDKYTDPNSKEVLLATILKLVVENFTLNLKLQQMRGV